MNGWTLVDLPEHGDIRGDLVALEAGTDIVPFEVKRVYYIFGVRPGITRGMHAHRKLRQLCICVCGSCDFVLDDGRSRETVRMDSPKKGLLLGNSIWREMKNFSPDCVLLVLVSAHYGEEDYIRSYEEFQKEVSRHD